MCPKTGHVLNAVPAYRPENNELVLNELERVALRYPRANCFVYDRAVGILKDLGKRKKDLWGIRTYATDNFHGARHKAGFPTNPRTRPELIRLIEGLNTGVAELTLTWFRCYARRMGELRQAARRLLVPMYAEFRTAPISDGETSRLDAYPRRVKIMAQTPYDCDEAIGDAPPKRRRTGK